MRSAAFAEARVLFDLPPGVFRPRPNVMSSVVAFSPRTPTIDPVLRDRALAIASLGFRSRRKTLVNALLPAGERSRWERNLARIGKDPRVRAETLSLEDFLALARSDAAEDAAAVPSNPGSSLSPSSVPGRR